MSKHHQQRKSQNNQGNTSVSVDPEIPDSFQEQIEGAQSSAEIGSTPTDEEIQRRAYQIHEEKGGSDVENWLEAERILRAEYHLDKK